MTGPADLAERIARLERVLDRLEQRRVGGRSASAPGNDPTPDDPLRDVVAMLEQRAGASALDEGDAIAMRALLEQCRAMTAELRAEASGLNHRLAELVARLTESRRHLDALEGQ